MDQGEDVAGRALAQRPVLREIRGRDGRTPRRQVAGDLEPEQDRKSVVEGKSVSVRVDLGGRSIIKKKKGRLAAKRRSRTMTLRRHRSTPTQNTKIRESHT